MSAKDYLDKLYRETNNITAAIKKYYHDENNFYDCVLIGVRISDKRKLCTVCRQRLESYIKQDLFNTADCGAFLCVLGYNDSSVKNSFHDRFYELCEKYLIEYDKNNPHCIRWCISICYMLGELKNDIYWYKRCLIYDFTKFHPTILTKQLSACKIIAMREPELTVRTCEYGLSLVDKMKDYDFTKIWGKSDIRYGTGYKEISEVLRLAYELSEMLNKKKV